MKFRDYFHYKNNEKCRQNHANAPKQSTARAAPSKQISIAAQLNPNKFLHNSHFYFHFSCTHQIYCLLLPHQLLTISHYCV